MWVATRYNKRRWAQCASNQPNAQGKVNPEMELAAIVQSTVAANSISGN
jgi:hypothetical protein